MLCYACEDEAVILVVFTGPIDGPTPCCATHAEEAAIRRQRAVNASPLN